MKLTATNLAHRRRFALLLLAAVAFLPFLGRRDIVTSHEGRVYQVARQMANAGWPWNARLIEVPAMRLVRDGAMLGLEPDASAPPLRVNPWLIPVINGQIRLQKPPLPYWCVATSFRFTGPGEAAARFPSAVLGALATIILFDLARHAIGRRSAWLAALIWVSSYFIFDEFRKAMADPYLAFFTLAAVWAWVRLSRSNQWRWAIVFYAAIALGGLAKGPPLLLHVAIPMIAWWAVAGRRAIGRWPQHAVGVVIILLTLAWPAYVLHHIPNALDMWRYESVGLLADNTEKARPWWFYLPGLLQIALPWTPALIAGAVVAIQRKRRMIFPLAWYAGVVLCFSLLHVKKNAYLLPLMPAQAMLCAVGLLWLLRSLRPPARRQTVLIAVIALIVIQHAVFSFFIAAADNRRSPRAIGAELTELLRQLGIGLRMKDLPEEASVYLPLNPQRDPSARRLLMIVDDRRNNVTSETLPKSLDGRPIRATRRLPLRSEPAENARWKVFELVLD